MSNNLEQGYQATLTASGLEKGFQSAAPKPPSQSLPSSQGPLFSSPKGFFGPGLLANVESRLTGKTPEEAYKKRIPQLETAAGTIAPMVLPGGKATSFLGRLGTGAAQGAGISGGLAALGGKGTAETAKEAGIGAAGQAAGVPIGAAARYLTSAIPKNLFARRSGRQLSNWLRTNVPGWASFKGPRALYRMAIEGEAPLRAEFDKAFTAAVKDLPEDATITIPQTAAKAAGIKNWVPEETRLSGRGFEPPPRVHVSAAEAAHKALGLGERDPESRRLIIDALAETGPAGWIPEARRAYKLGKGWREFGAGLFKEGEKYDPYVAQRALRSPPGQALEGREMTGVRNIIRGPSSIGPLSKYSPSPWAQRIAGLGLIGGGLYGGHPGLSALGAGLEVLPRTSFYRGVPPTAAAPALDAARRAAIQAYIQSQIQGPTQDPTSGTQ